MKLGIDLGTYNSSAAYILNGQEPMQVASRSGADVSGKQFPSFVKFDADGNVECIGQPARNALANNPQSVVWGAKRLVGRSYSSAQREFKRFAYPIERGENDTIVIRQGPQKYAPEQILQIILRGIRDDVLNPNVNPLLIGQRIDQAVITAPAYFDAFRYSGFIKDAAMQVGFASVNIIHEPVAAARRYGLQLTRPQRILAFDLGAGTLDVTVLQVVVGEGGDWFAEDTITSGEPEFGGIDIDDLLFEYVTRGMAIDGKPTNIATLRDKVERAKIELSEYTFASVPRPDGRTIRLTREEVSRLIIPVLEEKCSGPIRVALNPDGRALGPLIDRVLLIGGPTKMHCVREYVVPELRRNGVREDVLAEISLDPNAPNAVDPMNCVSEGAAATTGTMIIRDPFGYGTEIGGFYHTIIHVNSACPIEGEVKIGAEQFNRHLFTVPIFSRVPNTKVQEADASTYEWAYLGDFGLAVEPDGDNLLIRLHMSLNENKMATVKLQRIFRAGENAIAEISPVTGVRGEARTYFSLEHVRRTKISPMRERDDELPVGEPVPKREDGLPSLPGGQRPVSRPSSRSGAPKAPPPSGRDDRHPQPPRMIIATPLTRDQIQRICQEVRAALEKFVQPEIARPEAQCKPRYSEIMIEYEKVRDALHNVGRAPDSRAAKDLVNDTDTLLSSLTGWDIPNRHEVHEAISKLDKMLEI